MGLPLLPQVRDEQLLQVAPRQRRLRRRLEHLERFGSTLLFGRLFFQVACGSAKRFAERL